MQARGGVGGAPLTTEKGGVHNMTGSGVSRRKGKTSGQEVMQEEGGGGGEEGVG